MIPHYGAAAWCLCVNLFIVDFFSFRFHLLTRPRGGPPTHSPSPRRVGSLFMLLANHSFGFRRPTLAHPPTHPPLMLCVSTAHCFANPSRFPQRFASLVSIVHLSCACTFNCRRKVGRWTRDDTPGGFCEWKCRYCGRNDVTQTCQSV